MESHVHLFAEHLGFKFRLLVVRHSLRRLFGFSGQAFVFHIPDNRIFRLHLGPVVHLLENRDFGSLGQLFHYVTLDTAADPDLCVFVHCRHGLLVKGTVKLQAVRIFKCLIGEIRVLFYKIQCKINCVALFSGRHVVERLLILTDAHLRCPRDCGNHLVRQCVQDNPCRIIIILLTIIKTVVQVLLDIRKCHIVLAVQKPGAYIGILVSPHDCHIRVSGNAVLARKIRLLFGIGILVQHQFHAERAA